MTGSLPTGVITFPVTPMDDTAALNLGVYRELLDRTLDTGVAGVAPASTTGEGPYLTRDERMMLLEETVSHVAGRAAVVASASAASTSEAIAYAKHAEAAGADVVLASVVQFFPLDRSEIRRHYLALAEATELPIVLYNQPLSGVDLDPDLVAELAGATERIGGVKEASGLVSRVGAIARQTDPGFVVYCGHGDVALPSFLVGATGWFTAMANLVPAECQEMFDLAMAGDWSGARDLFEAMAPLCNLIYRRQLAANMKAALRDVGIPVGHARAPLSAPCDRDRELMTMHLAKLTSRPASRPAPRAS